jgi:hypothetical protein
MNFADYLTEEEFLRAFLNEDLGHQKDGELFIRYLYLCMKHMNIKVYGAQNFIDLVEMYNRGWALCSAFLKDETLVDWVNDGIARSASENTILLHMYREPVLVERLERIHNKLVAHYNFKKYKAQSLQA